MDCNKVKLEMRKLWMKLSVDNRYWLKWEFTLFSFQFVAIILSAIGFIIYTIISL
jgi:hypothetical protein